MRTARHSISGKQHPMPGQENRNAARRVTRNPHRHRPIAEPELVAVLNLPVDPRRHHRFHRQPTHDLVKYRPLPVRQIRRWPHTPRPHKRRIRPMGKHLHPIPATNDSRAADVVPMKVRQHQPPQIRRLKPTPPNRISNQRRGPRKTCINKREPIRIMPQISVPDRQPNEP